jgi:hypothetical protein
MIWINASVKVPDDNEEVLIRFETMVHLAVYDKNEDSFRLRNGEVIQVNKRRIEWMRLTGP